jgi:SAM-dependent methyltransferase
MLRPAEDVFGHAYMDYCEGKGDGVVTIDRDDGRSEAGCEAAAYFKQFQEWPAHQRHAMGHAKGRVLDIGCGVGRHSLHLQEKGCEVVGIDNSPLAVRLCRLRGLTDAREIGVTQISSKLGRFDTVLMLGNNFGLFGTFKRARWLLRRLRGMTSPEARIIAETLDPYAGADPIHLAYHERNRHRGRRGGQVRIRARYGEYKTRWFDLLLISRDEMTELLDGTGWQVGEFIDSGGPGYIAVLTKLGSRS